MNIRQAISRFLLKFSYFQKLSTVVLLTFLNAVAAAFALWYACSGLYDDTKLDQQTHEFQVNVSKITNLLADYQIEVVKGKYSLEPQNSTATLFLEKKINDQLAAFTSSLEAYQAESRVNSLQKKAYYHLEHTEDFFKMWDSYKQLVNTASLDVLDRKFEQLLESMDILQTNLRAGFRLYSNSDEGTKRLIDANFILIPRLVMQIPHYYTLINEDSRPKTAYSRIFIHADAYGIYLRQEMDRFKVNVALEKISELLDPYMKAEDRTFFVNVKEELKAVNEAVDTSLLNGNKDDVYQNAKKSLQIYGELQKRMSEMLKNLYALQFSTMQKKMLLGYGFILLAIFFIFGTYFTKIVMQPIEELSEAANQLGVGMLNVRIPVRFHDEVGNMSEGFNSLAEAIERRLGDVKAVSESLLYSVDAFFDIAKKLEENTAVQDAKLGEVKGHIKGITAIIKEFSLYLNEVYKSINASAGIADIGKRSLSKMDAVMQQMMQDSKNIVDTLSLLNVKISSIHNVISTVVKIADQINLLALNTAIQANKAGPEGRGFSVIAKKINEVSSQTASSTLDIETTVEDIVRAGENAVQEVNNFLNQVTIQVNDSTQLGNAFKKLIDYLQEETEQFKSVNKDMLKQAESATELQDVLQSLSNASKKTSSAVGQFRREIESLRTLTTILVEKIDSFTHPSYIQQTAAKLKEST